MTTATRSRSRHSWTKAPRGTRRCSWPPPACRPPPRAAVLRALPSRLRRRRRRCRRRCVRRTAPSRAPAITRVCFESRSWARTQSFWPPACSCCRQPTHAAVRELQPETCPRRVPRLAPLPRPQPLWLMYEQSDVSPDTLSSLSAAALIGELAVLNPDRFVLRKLEL